VDVGSDERETRDGYCGERRLSDGLQHVDALPLIGVEATNARSTGSSMHVTQTMTVLVMSVLELEYQLVHSL
jgi:hypothetical protein